MYISSSVPRQLLVNVSVNMYYFLDNSLVSTFVRPLQVAMPQNQTGKKPQGAPARLAGGPLTCE